MKILLSLILGVSVLQAQVKQVIIGTQVWMAKNLNVATFCNGDPIPQAKTAEEWINAGVNGRPAWCYYNNDPANGTNYGKLYNWYAVNDPRGLAPKGWHIPTRDEWTVLTDFLGGTEIAGTKMKSKTGWKNSSNGTNSSGFNGLPGGDRSHSGSFYLVGSYGYWWSSTEASTSSAWSHALSYDSDHGSSYYDSKGYGFYVRCLRD